MPVVIDSEPPIGLTYDYRSHLDNVVEPIEEQTFEPRRPRGPLEIHCPACKGYGYAPPAPLDVEKFTCRTCAEALAPFEVRSSLIPSPGSSPQMWIFWKSK